MSQEQEHQVSNNNEEMRKLLCPKPNASMLLRTLQTHYSNPPSNDAGTATSNIKIVKELDSYDDKNYLVQIDNTNYLCKVYNGVSSNEYKIHGTKSQIQLYMDLFDHLKPNDKINTSFPILTQDNKLYCSMSCDVASDKHSPQELIVQCLHWVEGVPMQHCKNLTLEDFVDAGHLLGHLRHALDDFTVTNPTITDYSKSLFSAWDVQYTDHLSKFTQYLDHDEELINNVINEFNDYKKAHGSKLRVGLCHGDFNDANIILLDNKVSGVIDFGDACYSWKVNDIAIAMAYSMLNPFSQHNQKAFAASTSFLRAFHSVYPLTDEEIMSLNILIKGRLAQSITYGAFTYQQNPGNEYILVHAKPAWNALKLISACTKQDIDDFFKVACKSGNTKNLIDLDIVDGNIVGKSN